MTQPGRPISLSAKGDAARRESTSTDDWAWASMTLIKRAMREKGWGYAELSEALKAQGIRRSPSVLNRRINRGNFTGGFLLACVAAMECELVLRSVPHPTR